MGLVCSDERKPRIQDGICPACVNKSNILSKYCLHKEILGHGQYGVVRKAFCKSTGKEVAIKSIPKIHLTREMKQIQQECAGLIALDHPNIIKFYDVYETSTHFYEVMQLATGDGLLNNLKTRKKFSELELAVIMRKAFLAVEYLHKRGVVHRDLKPENFMYVSKDPNAELKLIDFGFCKIIEEGDSLKTLLGTPYYLAPEVIEGYYDEKCDYWSLGIMMHYLLVGTYPFFSDNTARTLKKIVEGPLKMSEKGWDTVSADAKDLIRKLLNKDSNQRMTTSQALKHPWIKKVNDTSCLITPKLKSLLSLTDSASSGITTPKTTTDGDFTPRELLKISPKPSRVNEEVDKDNVNNLS